MGLSDLVTDHFHSCSLAFTGHFMSFWRFTAILRFETHPYPPSNRGSGDLTTADWNQVATLASEDQRTEAVRIPKRGSQHFLGNKMHRNHLEVSIGVPPVIIHWDFPPKKKTSYWGTSMYGTPHMKTAPLLGLWWGSFKINCDASRSGNHLIFSNVRDMNKRWRR